MIGRSILNYLPVNMANVLTAFGTIAVLTRLLEPAQFGTYAVAMITMQFLSEVSAYGTDLSLG